VEETSQPLETGRIVRGIHRLVVLAEELLTLWFGEVSQDHQRIGGVLRRLCGRSRASGRTISSAIVTLVSLQLRPPGQRVVRSPERSAGSQTVTLAFKADAVTRRRGHGEDAIYFAADKNRYIGAV
jgi:hypothetical protein